MTASSGVSPRSVKSQEVAAAMGQLDDLRAIASKLKKQIRADCASLVDDEMAGVGIVIALLQGWADDLQAGGEFGDPGEWTAISNALSRLDIVDADEGADK